MSVRRTADGLTLIATSSDGYASIFTFEEGELGVPASEQPKKALGPLEETLINGANALSPVKPGSTASTSNATSPAAHPNGLAIPTTTSKAENVFAPASVEKAEQRKPLQKEDSDIVMLSEAPPSMMNGAGEGQPKKVKKRVALTHVGPLGS